MKIIFLVLVVFMLAFAGCTSTSSVEKCISGTVMTANGKTSVCFEEKMTDVCSREGAIYKQTESSKIVCSDGKWVSQSISPTTPPNPSNSDSSSSSASDCSGITSTTVNGKTLACVNGKMVESCNQEGEIYSESEIFHDQVVCENGKWVEKSTE